MIGYLLVAYTAVLTIVAVVGTVLTFGELLAGFLRSVPQ